MKNIDDLLLNKNNDLTDAIKTLSKFQNGEYKPIKTSYEFLNEACLGGLLPNLMIAWLGRPSHGKCQKKGTKILMYNGSIKKVEDIKIGDKLMGPDSKPRTVLSLARGREEMYWVRQNKGIDYCVNKSHILSLKKSRQEGSMNKGDILNISVEDYLKKSDKFKSNYKGYKVDVEFPEKELLIDPYYLGLWLGDGNTNTIRYITNSDSEIISYVKSLGGEQSKSDKLRLMIPKGMYIEEFKHIYNLKNINSLTEKYIPNDYIINSKKNRLQLLAGLLDTDGHYTNDGSCFEITQKSKKLSEQIVFLCNSLGFRVKMVEKKSVIKSINFQGNYYRISIYGNLDIIPTKVKRKQAEKSKCKRDWRNTGIKLEYAGIDDYYGFTLTGDHLYLLEDMTVTHNTYVASQLKEDILKDKNRNIGLLYYNWEMPTFALLLTQLKKKLNKKFKEILYNQPSEEELNSMKEVADIFRDKRLTTVDRPLSPDEFDYITRKYIENNLDKEQLFIMIDHIGITKGENKQSTMFKLLEVCNNIKLDYKNKLTFIAFGQLNREIEKLWRTRDVNPINLRVTSEYVYGSDALQQFAEVIVANVIPDRAGLDKYCVVNRERYDHLSEHIIEEDINSPKDYVRLKGNNRIYYDLLKVRLDDGDPKLYCDIINKDQDDYDKVFSSYEKDLTYDEDDDIAF